MSENIGLQDPGADIHASLKAIIPHAKGKPVVLATGDGASAFFCRRNTGLRVDPEGTFYEECVWVDPPEVRPDELTDGMAISSEDCLQMGLGWWYDAYFDWFFVYEPAYVAWSETGDHLWKRPFLAGPTSRCWR